ncbi:SapC family protein [Sulfitobacter sp. D35]|uniref:SapC family protein n=1 Tax=Sulfitobacter sp. D35 TaxID=3083252 RepID=UPI00296E65C1|nr:SapC family protein [Sulfitobacter sp. D35]MDW4496648.1 SapC family protein [Sulfitobacter sp. D35]
MSKQLLIYERAMPVSSSRHRDWSVAQTRSFAFARELNAVPLVAAEILPASREYPIVFAGQGDEVVPSALLGVSDNSNAFVAEDGSWQGRYVPAFLRRYPFVFSRAGDDGDGQRFTLCVDEEYEGLNSDGRGERLFDAEGNRTQYLENTLNFVTQYQNQFTATEAFSKKLKELDLLEPAQVRFSLPGGRNGALGGFKKVSRDKLRGLPDDALLGLARSDELELIHCHLASLANVTPLAERVSQSSTTEADTAAPEPEAEAAEADA